MRLVVVLAISILGSCTFNENAGNAASGDGDAVGGSITKHYHESKTELGTVEIANPFNFPVQARIGSLASVWVAPGRFEMVTVPAGDHVVVLMDPNGMIVNRWQVTAGSRRPVRFDEY